MTVNLNEDQRFYIQSMLTDECMEPLRQQFNQYWAIKDQSFRFEWDNKKESIETGGIIHESWNDTEMQEDAPSPSLVLKEIEFEVDLESINRFIKDTLQKPLKANGHYGPRVYLNGAILELHTDDYQTTGIVFLGSDASESWPLVLYPDNESPREIHFKEGDLVIFDGYSMSHGRPNPFKGKYYAAIFLRMEACD